MRVKLKSKYALVGVALALILQACAAGTGMHTSPARPAEITGTYTLLLYGCHYPADIKNLAILVKAASPYRVEIYDIETSYKVKRGLSAENALREAEAFVKCSGMRNITGTEIRRIIHGKGGTVGYEVRAVYFPLEFGISDVLLVDYKLVDEKVRAYIRLDPDVERALESSGPDIRQNGGNRR